MYQNLLWSTTCGFTFEDNSIYDAVHSSRTYTHAHEPSRSSTVRVCHREKLDALLLYRGTLAFLTAAVVGARERQQKTDRGEIKKIN